MKKEQKKAELGRSMNYIEKVEEFAKKNLTGYSLKHTKLVVKLALELCENYADADIEIVAISAWLHDISHTDEDHHIKSSRIADKLLTKLGMDKKEEILHCILSHRTGRMPVPFTIEAEIVFSADNLSHFVDFQGLVKLRNFEWAYAKIQKDLKSGMLPEAKEKAEKIFKEIKR